VFAIGSFVLTPDEVEKRKRYLEIGPEDEDLLRAAHLHLQRHAGVIIGRFYDYLLGHEATRSMLTAPGLVERLKELQARYFTELTAGTYDLAYFENRLRVGLSHQRIGLTPEWYLGAYVKYLHIAADVLREAFGADVMRFSRTMVSLTKVIYLDMGLAIDAYHYSAKEGLERGNEELRRLDAVKRQLTDMIVHDLQNPLTGIVSALRVLESRGGLSPGDREALEEAVRRCGDLSAMIMNVLQVSRAEEGKIQTYIENLDLSAVAREVGSAFQRTAQSEGRALVVEAPAAVPVRTDQALLRRILENLVRNGLRHTPKGTRVTIRVENDPPRVSVIDDGPGIPPAIQGRIFDPFAAAALRGEGLRVDTGLGLPSCRAAARALGTDVTVLSDGKRGTTFSVAFP
jgi:signal transduction histidine kinase